MSLNLTTSERSRLAGAVIAALEKEFGQNLEPAPDPLADVKAAHARGEPIQYRDGNTDGKWFDISWTPGWFEKTEYRIKPWSLTRSIPGFRPLNEGEEWHRNDFEQEMLPEGWRPLLLHERTTDQDEYFDGSWVQGNTNPTAERFTFHTRTRRPLPDPQREAFEKWAKATQSFTGFDRTEGGTQYVYGGTQLAWVAWQAASKAARA